MERNERFISDPAELVANPRDARLREAVERSLGTGPSRVLEAALKATTKGGSKR